MSQFNPSMAAKKHVQNMFQFKIRSNKHLYTYTYIRASEDGCLMNQDKGTLINDCWDEFTSKVKMNVRTK